MTAIKRAMTAWLQAEYGLEDDMVVVSYEEDTYNSGYCETCYYEEQVLVFKAESLTTLETTSITVHHEFADIIQKLEQYSD